MLPDDALCQQPEPRTLEEIIATHRPLSSSFLALPYRILKINHKKELLRGPLWVDPKPGPKPLGFRVLGFRGLGV